MPYSSFFFSFGTTSFRTREFNKKIEEQLRLLDAFWKIPGNENLNWVPAVQETYYDYLKENGFLYGEAKRKAKDAREKTSGLSDFGFIDSNRRLTEVGKKLISIDFENVSDNILDLSPDSYIYLKQMLKVSFKFGKSDVRPFPILALLLNEFSYITDDEFKYLFPLITCKEKYEHIESKIPLIREKKIDIDDIISDLIMSNSNYKEACKMFLTAPSVNEKLIMDVGFNRKSRNYDKPYYALYQSLHKLCFEDVFEDDFVHKINNISGKPQTYWKEYLIDNTSKSGKKVLPKLNGDKKIFNCKDEKEFRKTFFVLMHLFKTKATLDDYSDLNRRYFKTTNVFLFEGQQVRYDFLPSFYFKSIGDELSIIAFIPSKDLENDLSLFEIIGKNISSQDLTNIIKNDLGDCYDTTEKVLGQLQNERLNRFNNIIDDKYTDDTLTELLTLFESRDDKKINEIVTDNADIPTIFEYIIAIIWYRMSGKKGDILSFMNLSLDSDLLPVSHASGGHEDILFKYEATPYYPPHQLLIEVTLSSGSAQRKMEVEPVTRHLANYMINDGLTDQDIYCTFIAPTLSPNLIGDFRDYGRRAYYRDSDNLKTISPLKLMPLSTDDLKKIISHHVSYPSIYGVFSEAYKRDDIQLEPLNWYEKNISKKF